MHRLPQPRPALRFALRHLQFVAILTLAAGLGILVTRLFALPFGSAILFLPLMLLGALGVRREFQTPSLTELAFYSSAFIAVLLIWPGAHLAVSAYEASGFVTLAAFMILVLALAIVLGVLAEKLFAAGEDDA